MKKPPDYGALPSAVPARQAPGPSMTGRCVSVPTTNM
jgi:hypothetical protein